MEEIKRVVRIVAQDKRYTKSHYRSVPIWKENWNTYLTGQHIDPDDESTSDNLTLDQMTGKQPLTAEQKKKFGYVINPDNGLLIKHNYRLDLSVDTSGNANNQKDYWEYEYLKQQPAVAPSKEEYNTDAHRFYIEDKVTDARKSISKREKVYSAVEKFRANLTMEKMHDIALSLNYYVPKFRVNPKKVSKIVLEEMIYEQCEQNPEFVLKCFGENAAMETYILKLCDRGILKRMGNDFSYGDTFVGQGLEKVQVFMSKEDNRATVNKWASLMKDDHTYTGLPKGESGQEEILKIFSDGLTAVISGDLAKISYTKKRLMELKATDYLKKITEAEENLKPSIDVENTSKDNDMPTLLTLKQQAGRMKIDKEVYQNMTQEELFNHIESLKSV